MQTVMMAIVILAGSADAQRAGVALDPFTVVGLPDTQRYSELYPEIFTSQTQWVVDNRRRERIRFVSHFGDIVQHADRPGEWQNARASMDILHGSGIPYGVAAGNHDVHSSGGHDEPYIPQNYLDNFGPQRFAGKPYFGGASPSGMSTWQTFSGGGREFLAMHINVDTPVEELVWAQGVLNQNRDKPVMLTTHRYLQDAEDYTGGLPLVPSGRYPDIWYAIEGVYSPGGIHAEELFQTFVRTNKQIFLVNAGHFHEEFRQTSTNLHGSPVHEVLADYQDDPNGGNGFLRLMRFDVAGSRIDVESYSPYLDQFLDKDESRFSLPVNFGDYAYAGRSYSFQNGVNGYGGTLDTWVGERSKNASHGNESTIVVDDDTENSIFSDDRAQGLIRFTGIVGQGEDQIPAGSVVESATLRVGFADDIDNPLASPDFDVYMMTRDWNESSTWNSLGGGIGDDLGLFLGTLAGDNDPDGDFWRVLDVTDAVQLWVNGGANLGFAIMPEIIGGNDDGIELFSSEWGNALLRPVLDVTIAEAPRPVPAPGVLAVVPLVALASRRRRGAL